MNEYTISHYTAWEKPDILTSGFGVIRTNA